MTRRVRSAVADLLVVLRRLRARRLLRGAHHGGTCSDRVPARMLERINETPPPVADDAHLLVRRRVREREYLARFAVRCRLLKAAFLVYLALPQTRGAQLLYERYVDPAVTRFDVWIGREERDPHVRTARG